MTSVKTLDETCSPAPTQLDKLKLKWEIEQAKLSGFVETADRVDFLVPAWNGEYVDTDDEEDDELKLEKVGGFRHGRNKTTTSAVAIVPPKSAWDSIQAIRQTEDRHVGRWPPHINLLYPFYEKEEFKNVLPLVTQCLSNGCVPFKVRLIGFNHFNHGKKSLILWLAPVADLVQGADPLKVLQANLQSAFPDCNDLADRDEYTPHLTVGQYKNKATMDSYVEKCRWDPIEFEVKEVQLIARDGPRDPFTVRYSVPLTGTMPSAVGVIQDPFASLSFGDVDMKHADKENRDSNRGDDECHKGRDDEQKAPRALKRMKAKPQGAPLKYVGGVDISFVDGQGGAPGGPSTDIACAALCVLSYPDMAVVYEKYEMVRLDHPYIPGFLAFREVGPLVSLLENLRKQKPEIYPQVLLVDGNGVLHHRGLGLASHIGVLADLPTIGVAKTLLCVDGLTREEVEAKCDARLLRFGDAYSLVGHSSKQPLGLALRTNSTLPLFISAGHRVCLHTAASIVLECSKFRIPEPIRAADLGSREVIRRWEQQKTPLTSASHHAVPSLRECGETEMLTGVCYRVPSTSDMHLLTLRRTPNAQALLEEERKTKKSRVHLTFICDCSISMGNDYKGLLIPACESSFKALQPDECTVILFGKEVSVFPIHSTSDIQALSNKKLEPATNIGLALECAVKNAVKHAHAAPASALESTYMFVLASDGQDNSNTPVALDKLIDEAGAIIHSSGIQSVFLVVGIGAQSDTKIGMKAKRALQTITCDDDDSAVHYATTPSDIPTVVAEMTSEQLTRREAFLLKILVTTEDEKDAAALTEHRCGFMASLSGTPTVQTAARLSDADDELSFIFKGDPTKLHILVNGDKVTVRSSIEDMSMTTLVDALSKISKDIAISAVVGHDVTNDMEILDAIVRSAKTESFSVGTLAHAAPKERIALMRKVKGKIVELERTINELKDKCRMMKNASSQQQAMFLRSAKDMKYGSQALKRGRSADADKIFQSIVTAYAQFKNHLKQKQYKARQMEEDLKVRESKTMEDESQDLEGNDFEHESIISAQSETEHLLQMSEAAGMASDELSVLDLLYAFGMVGRLMKVAINNASAVDPWQLKIGYISSDCADTASCLCALHADHDVTDVSQNQAVEDVLVLLNPRSELPAKLYLQSQLYNTYLSVVFARNLDMYMPAQKFAILAVSLVQAVKQLRAPHTRSIKHLETPLHIIFTLRVMYTKLFGPTGEWSQHVLRLVTEAKPGRLMTETEGSEIGSVCKLLAMLACCDEATPLFGKESKEDKENKEEQDRVQMMSQKKEVGIAILAEAVSRDARAFTKTGLTTLRRACNITAASCPQPLPDAEEEPEFSTMQFSGDCDMGSLLAFADQLSGHPMSNCGVEAVLAFLRYLHVLHSDVIPLCVELAQEKRRRKKASMVETEGGSKERRVHLNSGDQAEEIECGLKDAKTEGAADAEEEMADLHEESMKAHGIMCLLTLLRSTEPEDVKEVDGVLKLVQNAFERPVNMEWFAEEYLGPGVSLPAFRGALVAQGLVYHVSRDRKGGLPSLTNPEAVLEELVKGERGRMYLELAEDKMTRARAALAEQRRLERIRLEEAARTSFMESHGGPTCEQPPMWTEEKVAEYNKSRPPDDQLELVSSSRLLKHHCCFETCVFHLKNMATPFDRAFGTRHGLFDHLGPMTSAPTYFPGFHIRAMQRLRLTPEESMEEFCVAMQAQFLASFPNADDTHLEANLIKLWQEWKKMEAAPKGTKRKH